MSGIAGIWYRDGQPLETTVISRLCEELMHRGPDGRGVWTSQAFATASLGTHVLLESSRARQPMVDTSAGAVLSFDGRIDNRDGLTHALGDAGRPPQSDADAEIVLRACQAWGADAPRRLIGDFAFSYWDEPHRRLLCARDIRGSRPFCYRIDGPRVAWASELHALVRPPFDEPAPNEGFIAEHLANILNSTDETVFEGVFRLPPASLLIVTPDAVRVARYWQIDPAREIRYSDPSEYNHQYLSLVREAVRCRLRARGGVGIMLSGGLDSSVLAAVAAQLSVGQGRRPRTFSLGYPGHPCDERPFIEDVVRKWDLPATIIDNPSANPYKADVRRYRDLPSYPSGAGAEALFVRARQDGVRVLLTGLGGDEWFTGHPAHYADMLRGGEVVRLWRAVRSDRRSRTFGGWRQSMWNAARPFLSDRVLEGARRVAHHSPLPPWIRPSFAARVGLRDRIYSAPRRFGFSTHAQNELYREATAGFVVHAQEMLNRTVSAHGLDITHPLDDRRIIEFAMAIPEDERWKDGRPKAIVRRAAADLLPASVRTRNSDLDYDFPYREAMQRLDARTRLSAASAVFDQWIDRKVLLDRFDRVVGAPGANTWPLWMALAVRLWADDVIDRRPADGILGPLRHTA